MDSLDRSLHPDIHTMEHVDEVVHAFAASCSCGTMTPEPRRHSGDCRYRHLAVRLEELSPAK